MKSWNSHLHHLFTVMHEPRNISGQNNLSWSAHFPSRLHSFTRLAHFCQLVSSGPFPTGVPFTRFPSANSFVSFNFRLLCPKSIILVIQGRLRVDRMWIFLHLIMNGGNNEEFFYGWKWWKLHNQSMGHFQPAIMNTIRFRKRPIF